MNSEKVSYISDSIINQLMWQMDRLTNGLDKMCSRLEILEKDYSERTLKRKIINILFGTYPILMCIMLLFSGSKMDTIFKDTDNILSKISAIIEYS
jgi:hypothetical protein